MLNAFERLQFRAEVRSRSTIPNAIAAVAIIELLAVLFFFPSVAFVLLIACAVSLAVIGIVLMAFYMFNELCWLVSGRRF